LLQTREKSWNLLPFGATTTSLDYGARAPQVSKVYWAYVVVISESDYFDGSLNINHQNARHTEACAKQTGAGGLSTPRGIDRCFKIGSAAPTPPVLTIFAESSRGITRTYKAQQKHLRTRARSINPMVPLCGRVCAQANNIKATSVRVRRASFHMSFTSDAVKGPRSANVFQIY
jgi:hypothetical protein